MVAPFIAQEIGPFIGSWALSMRPFSLSPPEMGEATISVVQTGRLMVFALTRSIPAQ